MSILEVELKGFPRICYQNEEIEFRTTKSQALFIYLLVESFQHPNQKIAREKLTDLLWPGMPLSSALQNLRQCIYQTRKSLASLNPSEEEEYEWIISDRKTILLRTNSSIQLDIAPYLDPSLLSLTPLDQLPKPPLNLLENFYVPESEAFDTWVEQLRLHVKKVAIKHLKNQIEDLKSQENWTAIPPLADSLISWDPLQENHYRYLIEAQVKNKQVSAAQNTLKRLEKILKEELGIPLSQETQALLVENTSEVPREEKKLEVISAQAVKSKRFAWLGGVALFIILTSTLLWQFWKYPYSPAKTSEVYSIAVLPFKQDQVEEYVVKGLSESVIEYLSRVKGLKVISTQSTARYPQTRNDPQEIGEELGVGYLLLGEVSQKDRQIRAQIRLLQTSTGKVYWSESFEHPMRDIFQFPQEIARKTTEQLGVASLGLNFPKTEVYTPDSEAYDWYLKGREAFYHVYADSLRQAITCYRKALTIDPNFTLARIHLAWTNCTLAGTWGDEQIEDIYIETMLHLDAVKQKPAYRDMYHIIHGFLNLWTLDKQNALRQFQKAVSTNPNIDFGYGGLSLMYTLLGRYEEAKQMAYKSLELNPHFFWNKFCLAEAHFFAGEYAAAERYARETIAVNPNHFSSIAIVGRSLAAQGKFKEAIDILKPTEQKGPYLKGQLGIVYFHAGQKDKALAILGDMENSHKQGEKRLAYYTAMLHNLMGDSQKALDWLDISLANVENQLNWVEVDHEFKNLHDTPRFKKLLQDIPKAFKNKVTP